MSTVAEIHAQHAAKKKQFGAVRDEAAAHLRSHERTAKEKSSRWAEIEAGLVANATARALDQEEPYEVPDAIEIETLKADIAVIEPVRRQLAANLEAREHALQAATTSHNAAVASYLDETAMKPALAELEAAWDQLRAAAVNVMAAHHLVHRKFNDRAPMPNSHADLYGPMAEWLTDVRGMEWPTYPYEIRPLWIPQQGRFFADELRGVSDRVEQLLADVEQVPA